MNIRRKSSLTTASKPTWKQPINGKSRPISGQLPWQPGTGRNSQRTCSSQSASNDGHSFRPEIKCTGEPHILTGFRSLEEECIEMRTWAGITEAGECTNIPKMMPGWTFHCKFKEMAVRHQKAAARTFQLKIEHSRMPSGKVALKYFKTLVSYLNIPFGNENKLLLIRAKIHALKQCLQNKVTNSTIVIILQSSWSSSSLGFVMTSHSSDHRCEKLYYAFYFLHKNAFIKVFLFLKVFCFPEAKFLFW